MAYPESASKTQESLEVVKLFDKLSPEEKEAMILHVKEVEHGAYF